MRAGEEVVAAEVITNSTAGLQLPPAATTVRREQQRSEAGTTTASTITALPLHQRLTTREAIKAGSMLDTTLKEKTDLTQLPPQPTMGSRRRARLARRFRPK
ncbi:hypothetical protein ElyMa_004260200 [Elysia marginata]|uniref:Uncharacterized protein n=1 Tax=Elysia marginata TaxID=1093978 RepID=A0AAV4GTW5_9GAST|nr:hypothetical protein ElyMa_004260200 [Elysia marginata]